MFKFHPAKNLTESIQKVGEYHSKSGHTTSINHTANGFIDQNILNKYIDCIIMYPEVGFSQLSFSFSFLSKSLNIEIPTIGELARYVWQESKHVCIAGIKSREQNSTLKGLILIPHRGSECYDRFRSNSIYGTPKPHRDFHYNIAYESISYAVNELNASKILLSQQCSHIRYHKDQATCTAEALAHICDENRLSPVESLTYHHNKFNESHTAGISRLNKEIHTLSHHPIKTSKSTLYDCDIIAIEW